MLASPATTRVQFRDTRTGRTVTMDGVGIVPDACTTYMVFVPHPWEVYVIQQHGTGRVLGGPQWPGAVLSYGARVVCDQWPHLHATVRGIKRLLHFRSLGRRQIYPQ